MDVCMSEPRGHSSIKYLVQNPCAFVGSSIIRPACTWILSLAITSVRVEDGSPCMSQGDIVYSIKHLV